MKDRLTCIGNLASHLGGDAPHRTPAEALRCARFVPGWAVTQGPVGRWTVSGGGLADAVVDSHALIAHLRTHWLPEAMHELLSPAESSQVEP